MIHIKIKSTIIAIASALFFTGCTSGDAAFSRASQLQGNALCADLFNTSDILPLKSKMPILPGEIPSQEMLQINTAPTPKEAKAIQSLEGAIRTCNLMRTAKGIPTSATEDIVEQQLSRLRYGLYNGDIPYAVYNYGLVQALKEQSEFRKSAHEAYAKGAKEGTQAQLLMSLFTGGLSPMTLGTMAWSCSTLDEGVSCY